jgi:hypothetical protein
MSFETSAAGQAGTVVCKGHEHWHHLVRHDTVSNMSHEVGCSPHRRLDCMPMVVPPGLSVATLHEQTLSLPLLLVCGVVCADVGGWPVGRVYMDCRWQLQQPG